MIYNPSNTHTAQNAIELPGLNKLSKNIAHYHIICYTTIITPLVLLLKLVFDVQPFIHLLKVATTRVYDEVVKSYTC